MNDEPILTEAQRVQEELVAYLDGELDADASDRIERRLAEDPAYRQQLNDLQAAWDLLDQLPRAHVTESFTQSTVEMVAVKAQDEAQHLAKSVDQRRRLGLVALAASGLLAAVAGYRLVGQRLDLPNQELARDLPLIENVDIYRVAENVEFLRTLEESGLFEEEQTDVP